MTDPILDTARELLALTKEDSALVISRESLVSICRALIARTEALRECMSCMDSLRDFVAEGDSFIAALIAATKRAESA